MYLSKLAMSKKRQRLLATSAITPMLMTGGMAYAQQDAEPDEIVVEGIRGSLQSALNEKRDADSLIEVIKAEDIGKLPDQNLAEVLENITGIQITRTAGVGTNVQIRGTDDNRTEINGVTTLASGSTRSGIDFEDVNSAIIAAVEVTKVPEASTIEGSVGGTINLRTIRPLELSDLLLTARIQGQQNNLSEEGIQPRFSGAFGNNWDTSIGEIGFVISGSYIQQEAVSFRPRADRDNLATIPGNNPEQFLGIQFLLQEQENDDFETFNIASTIEWQPSDELKFHFDAFVNDQQRSRDQYRLQASGVSSLIGVTVPTSFETVDFGQGIDLGNGPGVIPAALTGTLEPDPDVSTSNPNLRFTTETGSRVTFSSVYAAGAEWQRGNWTAYAEYARSRSRTSNPTLNTTLNFDNPNAPFTSTELGLNDNAVPFIFDLSGESLAFGINFASPFAPTPEQLLDPSNVLLDQVQVGANTTDNADDSVRLDLVYDFVDNGFLGDVLTSFDVGYRYNRTSSVFEDIDDNLGGFSQLADSPRGDLFSEILIPGPTNFGDADGRDLFIQNFLLVDPDISFEDPQFVIDLLQNAIIAVDDTPDILNLQSDQDAFFDVSESTNAFYAQLNFESGIFRGNLGARYINTSIDSTGFGPELNGVRELQTLSGSYDFLLPRFNLIANVTDNFLVRLGYGSDILRPDFNDLGGFEFDTSENASVGLGNPNLQPQTVDSFDVSFEWYFAPASVISVGFFEKNRTNIFVSETSPALLVDGPAPDGFLTPGGFSRETDPSCPGGGIFNPQVVPNVLGNPEILGLCVDLSQIVNDPATTTQRGIEVAFQYDLSGWEDRIGWASGFGVIANYTYQEFTGGSAVDTASGRGSAVLGEIEIPEGLLDFSNNAYNVTLYYERYGLSARARYTWRDEFRTNDFGGGANVSGSSTFGFPVITEARGQLNASISYQVTDWFSVGVEAINLTSSNIVQRCVSSTGPICFVGFPDRRITFGGTFRY